MRTAVLIAVCIAALGGCLTPVKRVSTPLVLTPFDDDPVSFLVVRRFTPGEVAIVRVCVAPDRTIISADLVESSGDARFDSMALAWAQSVRLRSAPASGTPMAACGEVRVEIRVPAEPRVFSGSDTSLG
ncbi:MAG TPA: hypothetical protein VNZ06_11270 [Steroidobacteraceae bacterium]|nr:hypothetical protein [Steroidobacteraceae bacterium]